jgi:hypothetical protein
MATYIYSIIQEGRPQIFTIHGLENKVVHSIGLGDLGAVVSECSNTNFDALDKGELTKCILAHQKVNEELLKNYDVIPMSFGMATKNKQEVTDILGKAYLQFKRALKKVENKAEFVVQAFWDEKRVLEDMSNSNTEIQRLREEARALGKILGMAARLKLGKLVVETLKDHRAELSKEIEKALKEVSCDQAHAPLQDTGMVLNVSVLVDKFRDDELDKRMQGLGEKFKDVLRFKYIGPMPPGSFVHINLSLGNADLIHNARQVLGLPEVAAFDDVKRVYLGLAQKYHPDKYEYINDPKVLGKMTDKMKQIQEAYEALESYCRLYVDPIPSDTYSFRREDVEKSLLVKES